MKKGKTIYLTYRQLELATVAIMQEYEAINEYANSEDTKTLSAILDKLKK